MASKHNLSRATNLYWGDAYFAPVFNTNERPGVPFHPLTKLILGSPDALDANGLVVAATSTELPDTATITYTTATDNTSPLDGAIAAPTAIAMNDGTTPLVWTLDVPRNITMDVTHGTAALAMTVTITGYDVYKNKMVETLSTTAGTTSKSAAGKKAFKYIYSYAITSPSDATTNTLDIGWGDVLGLPYMLNVKSDLMQVWFNNILETTAATSVVGATATATATTGDVRGTINLNSALDGSPVAAWVRLVPTSKETMVGVDQYAG